jgi:hypothetical protein
MQITRTQSSLRLEVTGIGTLLGSAANVCLRRRSRLLQQFLVRKFAKLQSQRIAHSVGDKLAALVARNDPRRCQQRKML